MPLPEVNQWAQLPDEEDFTDDPRGWALRWQAELQVASADRKKWEDNATKITRRYLDEREQQSGARINVFWSNVQVLLAAVYSRIPQPEVDRRFRDFQDDSARVASSMLERILCSDLASPVDPTAANFRLAIQDRFISGLGNVWVRYDVTTERYTMPEVRNPSTDDIWAQAQDYECVVNEAAPIDYVHWRDFWWSPCRIWNEVRWVARRVYMTRSRLCERFGEELGSKIPLNATQKNRGAQTTIKSTADEMSRRQVWRQAEIFEIWDRDDKRAYWISRDWPTSLDMLEDPLGVTGFFPCPKPLIATTSTSRLMPRPDYVLTQDQYEQLDLVEARLDKLTRACKAVGLYDKHNDGIQRIFVESVDNTLLPIENWASFAERGGMKGSVDWMPLEQITGTIEALTARKQAILADLWQLLGINDIMRGGSDPQTTLGAEQMKMQFGGARLGNVQTDVANWVRDAMQIRSEVIEHHFQDRTIIERSNVQNTPDVQYIPQAMQLLRSADTGFRLMVDADSLAAPDWQQERDSRVQFMQVLSQYIGAAFQMVQQAPGTAPYALRFLQWAAAGFRVGRSIESVLDQAVQSMEQQVQQMQQTGAGGQAQGTQAKDAAQAQLYSAQASQVQATTQLEMQRLQLEMQKLQMQLNADMQRAQLDAETRMRIAAQQAETDRMIAAEKISTDAQMQAMTTVQQARDDERQAGIEVAKIEAENVRSATEAAVQASEGRDVQMMSERPGQGG